jgi:ankyrin repeat protein/predicted DNA-binding WGR domain protein
MPWREFWLIEHKVKKFWKIQLAGNSYTVVAGRKGTKGRTTTKEFPTKEEAEGAYLAAMSQAAGEGYREGDEQAADYRQAWKDWNVTALREFFRTNPELASERGPDGETPLHAAVRYGRCAVAKLLLEHGADVNARGGEDDETPFGLAIEDFDSGNKNDVRMVELLLQYHPDLSIVDQRGGTLSYRVASIPELAALLERQGIAQDRDPAPKLIAALEQKGLAYVQKQLEADPQLLNSPRIGDVLGTAITGSGDRAYGFVSFLLDRGVNPDVTCHGQLLIAWAVEQARAPKVVRLLLERGTDLKRLEKGGRTLLLSAIYVRAQKEIINDLIRFGVKKDLIVQFETDGAKKVIAELQRDPSLVRELDDPVELLNRGIGSEELVELLLQLGVDPNAHGTARKAPLRLAVRNANVNVVRLLLDHGADPNPNDVEGQYPVLYEGMQEAHAERIKKIIELLIARGARTMPSHEESMKQLDAMIARRARGKKK